MQRQRARAATVAFSVMLAMFACRMTPIREPDVVAVPQGLTEAQVKKAIELAISQPPRQDPEDTSRWFAEGAEPGVVFAGYQQGQYLLATAIRYNTHDVRVEIIRNENLSPSRLELTQPFARSSSKNQIHKEVYTWISSLELKIRLELSKMMLRSG